MPQNSRNATLTLREHLATRDNALNFVRLLLATIVIFAHSWLLGGFEGGPRIDFGAWAVHGFFAISGYLIAGSRMRLGLREFMANRALRIFPAFWSVLIGVALVVAPVLSFIEGWEYSVSNAVGYIVKNAGLYIFQPKIYNTLEGMPFPWYWNGSLWTLFFEFAAYVGAGLLLTFAIARRRPVVVVGTLLASSIVVQYILVEHLGVEDDFVLKALRLAPYFLAGMLIYFVSDRIQVRTSYFLAALLIFIALIPLGLADMFGQIPLSFAILWLGAKLPVRLGARNDISYGIYIWGWPMQLVVLALGGEMLGAPLAGLLAFACSIPLALASWHFVEKPAMKLRRHLPRAWSARPTSTTESSR